MVELTDSSERLLWQGSARLIFLGAVREVNCQVLLRSGRELRLKMDDLGSQLSGRELTETLNGEIAKLQISGVAEPVELFRVDTQINDQGEVSIVFRPSRSPIWLIRSEALRRGRAEIVNFAQYWIGSPAKSGFELNACGWKAFFIPVSDDTLAIAKWMHNEEYRISHQVEFEREDGSAFTAADAQDFLSKLSLFLSFCHGQWVSTSFATAMSQAGEVALQQWGIGRVAPWRDPSGWLDLLHGGAVCQIFDAFYGKLQDNAWNDAMNHVVYWFTRADTNNAGPDGACILLQAALERFAWHILVREQGAISEKGFKKLAAADQLRLMLNALSIPAAIPEGLTKLAEFAKANGFDGPEAFTHIRNRVVHPPKVSDKAQILPYYEAYCLAKWYVELAVLSACKYIGEYSNRTRGRRWVGEVEMVPWAPASLLQQ